MTDKLREALENIRSLVEETWGFASTSPRGKENLTEVLNLLDLLCAPSAGPPAPIAGVTAIYCGWGCSCVTQCGDTYDYAGQPKPPLRPAAPAQPPAALETCQNCGDLPYPGCSSEFQGEPSCRFWPAAAPSVEAEPVRRLVDAAMAVISRHDEWVRQMPAGAFDDPLSVSLAALHDAAETVGISLDIVRRYAAPPL